MTISSDVWTPDPSAKLATGSRRTRAWERTPNWGKLPPDDVPVNPYQDRRAAFFQARRDEDFTLNLSTGVKTVVNPAGYRLMLSDLDSALGAAYNDAGYAPPRSADANGNAVKTLVAVSDAKVNLAVTLAEAGKTADMILGTARRLDRAYRAFRRGRLGEVANLLNIPPKKVHKTWLEYKYGWMPLLMDVKGTAEAFAQQVVGRAPRFSVRKNSQIPFEWSLTSQYAAWGGGAPGTFTRRLVGHYQCSHKLWCEITSSTYSTAQQLGLTNPALVLWELTPFSFVFDWFISVGDYLTALTALNGVNVRKGMFSNANKLTFTYEQPATVRVQGTTSYNLAYVYHGAVLNQYSRSSYSPSLLDIYPPSNIGSLSFTKLVTGLALMRAQQR